MKSISALAPWHRTGLRFSSPDSKKNNRDSKSRYREQHAACVHAVLLIHPQGRQSSFQAKGHGLTHDEGPKTP